ncbi:MAG: hypothetical protein AAF458_19985 [Pseudomonadota bacterium]
MEFELVFDLTRDRTVVLEALAGAALVAALLVIIIRYPRWFCDPGHELIVRRRAVAIAALVFAAVVLAVISDASNRTVQRYVRGDFETAEGYVEDFRPMPATGHQRERFSVAGRTFAYSDFVRSDGFNQTRAHGGPIEGGLYVRVGYIGDTIVRLEIRQP